MLTAHRQLLTTHHPLLTTSRLSRPSTQRACSSLVQPSPRVEARDRTRPPSPRGPARAHHEQLVPTVALLVSVMPAPTPRLVPRPNSAVGPEPAPAALPRAVPATELLLRGQRHYHGAPLLTSVAWPAAAAVVVAVATMVDHSLHRRSSPIQLWWLERRARALNR